MYFLKKMGDSQPCELSWEKDFQSKGSKLKLGGCKGMKKNYHSSDPAVKIGYWRQHASVDLFLPSRLVLQDYHFSSGLWGQVL